MCCVGRGVCVVYVEVCVCVASVLLRPGGLQLSQRLPISPALLGEWLVHLAVVMEPRLPVAIGTGRLGEVAAVGVRG